MDHNNNKNLASASFNTMNEPFIPTQTIATVIPTIPAISKLQLTNLMTYMITTMSIITFQMPTLISN